MADNPQEAVLGNWAGREVALANSGQPRVRVIMLHVRGVDQCNQDVDVKQKSRHVCSSRSWLTNSRVTGALPFRAGKRGTPLRTWRELRVLRVSPCHANADNDFADTLALALR